MKLVALDTKRDTPARPIRQIIPLLKFERTVVRNGLSRSAI
jgi:hypothetical protein